MRAPPPNKSCVTPAGNGIPLLQPEHFKYLSIFISEALTCNRQRQETERSLLRHLGFLRRTLHSVESNVCLSSSESHFLASSHRAQCVPFQLDFLHQCDGQVAVFFRQKFRLPGNTAEASIFRREQAEQRLRSTTPLQLSAPEQ